MLISSILSRNLNRYLILFCLIYYLILGTYASLPIESNCEGSSICTTPSFCQESWTYTTRRCYRTMSSASYLEARSICNVEKAYLPVVTNSDENSYLASAEGSSAKWIGYTDIISEGYYIWDNEYRTSTTFTDWHPGEPNSGAEDCAMYLSGGQWNDVKCRNRYITICEMDLTPRQWYPHGNSMYLFNTITQIWQYAKDSCEDVGAHLAVISDYNEFQFIVSMMRSSYVWIGINDYASETTYVWPDSGEYSSYTNWGSSQPNHYSSEDGVRMGTSDWHDVPISWSYQSVCEKGIEWEYFNGKRYFATDYRLSASDAIARCTDIGGALAVISSIEENTFLVNMIAKIHYSQRDFYIGYVSNSDAVWSWPDSTEPVFSNWGDGEGQLGSACAALSLATGEWKDESCTSTLGFICEAEIPWVPWHDEKYYINTTPMPYDKAREVCMKIGGDLVSYDTVEEQKVVESIMERTSIITSKYRHVYIGNRKEDDVFIWARTNTASSLSNWCSDEPSGGSEYCTEYMSESDCYNDISCSTFRASICEVDIYPSDGAIWEQRRFFLNAKALNYASASNECNEMGMELASITSIHEMETASALISLSGHSSYYTYIGYDDIDTEGTYVWKSAGSRSQSPGLEIWSGSATFDDTNDCTAMEPSSQVWHSVPCTNNYNHLCEIVGEDDFVFIDGGVSDQHNACIDGHSLQEVKVRSLLECMRSCTQNVGCLSINFYPKLLQDDVTNCQLNGVLKSDHPDDVVGSSSTCEYYQLKYM